MMTHFYQLAQVQYQIGQYSGTITVKSRMDDDNDRIISVAKVILNRKYGALSTGLESYSVISRSEI